MTVSPARPSTFRSVRATTFPRTRCGSAAPSPLGAKSSTAPGAGIQQRRNPLVGRLQIYGSGKERQGEVRTHVDGKIKVGDDGRLPKSDIRV